VVAKKHVLGSDGTLFVLVFITTFAFYYYTSCPTIGLGDTGIMLDAMHKGNLSVHVNNHPLTVFFGWAFSKLFWFRDLAVPGTMVSVLFGSVTITIFFAAVKRAFNRTDVAASSALIMMFCQSMWWHSTIVENYAASAMFTASFVYLLVRLREDQHDRHIWCMYAIEGLAVFNHVQMGFMGVAIALTTAAHAWNTRRGRTARSWEALFGGCVLWGFAGFLPWLYLLYGEAQLQNSLVLALRTAFFGSFQHIMLKGSVIDGLRDFAIMLVVQFPSLMIFVVLFAPVFFVIRVRSLTLFVGVLAHFLINTWFFLTYNTWDKYAFMLPSFVLLTFMASFVVNEILQSRLFRSRVAKGLFGLFIIANCWGAASMLEAIPKWANHRGSIWFERYNNVYTHHLYRVNDYIVNPNKREFRDLDYFVRKLFDKLPENAIYIDDDSRAYYPVEFYYRFYNMRRDLALLIFNSWDIPNWGVRPEEIHSKFDRLIEGRSGRLFLVSTDRPFARVIDQYSKREQIKFERFPLDSEKWIYEVIVKSPQTGKRAKPQTLKLRDWFEISSDMIVSRRSLATVTDQEMHAFGSEWQNGNQSFVRVEKEGGFAEFAFKSEKVQRGMLKIFFATAPDFADVQVSLDGQDLGAVTKLTSESVRRQAITFGPINLDAGEHRLRVTVSEGQKFQAFGIDGMTISDR